jgi:hypothetical protein
MSRAVQTLQDRTLNYAQENIWKNSVKLDKEPGGSGLPYIATRTVVFRAALETINAHSGGAVVDGGYRVDKYHRQYMANLDQIVEGLIILMNRANPTIKDKDGATEYIHVMDPDSEDYETLEEIVEDYLCDLCLNNLLVETDVTIQVIGERVGIPYYFREEHPY